MAVHQSSRGELTSKLCIMAAVVALGIVACSDDDTPAPASSNSAGTGGSTLGKPASSEGGATNSTNTAVNNTTGGTGSNTVSATGGAGATATSGTNPTTNAVVVQTNLPATARTSVQATAVGTKLSLMSLNVVPDPKSTINYIEFFGELKNTGSSLVCFPKIQFQFTAASGTVLWSDIAYADTAPYVTTSSTVSASCLEPGESGALWSNELPAAPISVSSIAALTVSLDGLDTTATRVPHTLTVSIVEDTIYVDNNHWAMSGSFKSSQAVRNIMISGFTKANSGLLTGRLSATNLGSVAANTAWPFATDLGVAGPKPIAILAYASLILGTSTSGVASSMSPLTVDPILDPLGVERNERRKLLEQRLALAMQSRR
ncbi:MAG TPA: hypothetical protein VIV60_04620 [Polyangiaceae bacterium]